MIASCISVQIGCWFHTGYRLTFVFVLVLPLPMATLRAASVGQESHVVCVVYCSVSMYNPIILENKGESNLLLIRDRRFPLPTTSI